MNSQEKKHSYCASCRNNYYNDPGNSTSGECWSLDKATVVQRVRVGIWEPPPYTHHEPEKTLSCHHFDGRDTWIKPDDPRIEK